MPEILVEVLVGSDVAAPALQTHLHVELATLAYGGNVDVLVQYFDVPIRLDHARGHDARSIRAQVDRLRRIARKLERNLLEVQDDVGRVFHHARDRLELVQHAFDLDGGHGRPLDRAQQHAPQSIADGGAEAALKGLRPEHSVLVGERGGVGGETFWFLKTLPKHVFLLRPFGSLPSSPNWSRSRVKCRRKG